MPIEGRRSGQLPAGPQCHRAKFRLFCTQLRRETRHMFSIIGIVIVFGAVLGGFLMEKGPLAVLMQPSELVIIGGASLRTLLTANPMNVLKKIVGGLTLILGGSKFSKQRYIDTLKMMFAVFNKARKEG